MGFKTATAGVIKTLVDSAAAAIEGATKTADFNSESFDSKGYLFVGLYLKTSSVTGTSPTLDVTLETSPDGGTTWFNCPEDVNSTTQAAMTQMTAAASEFKYFAIPSVEAAHRDPGAVPLFRWKFDLGGTSPSFDIDFARMVLFAGTN